MVMLSDPNDVENLENRVRPPYENPTGFDDRISFNGALEMAVYFRDKEGSHLLLKGLRKIYPKAVEAQMNAAEAKVRLLLKEEVPPKKNHKTTVTRAVGSHRGVPA